MHILKIVIDTCLYKYTVVSRIIISTFNDIALKGGPVGNLRQIIFVFQHIFR